MKTIKFITNKNTTFSVTVPENWTIQECIVYANSELALWNMYVIAEDKE